MNSDDTVIRNPDHNPFEAPSVTFDSDGMSYTPAETIRREHLSHEASVKSIGFLYMLGGILLGLATIGLLFFAKTGPGRGPNRAPNWGDLVLAMMPLLAAIQCVTAVGLRRLRGWARIPCGVLAAIGLIGFPIGTLINGYILYLLFSAKGSMVFSEEYQTIIAQTPHIKYKTSIIVWLFLGLLLLLLTLGIAGTLIG